MHDAIVVAIAILSTGWNPRGAAAGAGFGFALLLCPLVMGTMMWFMMRQPKSAAGTEDRSEPVAREV